MPTALRAPSLEGLVQDGAIQLGLFYEADFEVSHPDNDPGERLVACKNPILAGERTKNPP